MQRARTVVLVAVLAAAVPAVVGEVAADADPPAIDCDADNHVTRSLTGGSTTLPNKPILRFVNLSDSHIIDDEASPVITGNWTESALDPAIGNGSAQRLQEEYTDEVLNAMVATINHCRDQIPAPKLDFMIATGDLTDAATLNEARRYIDNLDGVSGAPTAYERHCGYTTHDSRGEPKAGAAPCTPAMQSLFAGPTGRLVADSQAPAPDPDDPTYQLTPTRSARQIAETAAASVAGGSQLTAPGLPPALRCATGGQCDNERLEIPHYAVFGNHDGAVRGTVTFQQPFQAGFAAFGRYFLESQRELVNEFFFTEPDPGPIGHGFNHVESSRFTDANDRNDGYYAFDAAGGAVRMVVLNTIADGVRDELHRGGQTNADTGGLVTGNEVTDPRGLEMGVMDEAQYQWLAGELAAADAAGQATLVFSHHPDVSFTEHRLGEPLGDRSAVEVDELLGSHESVVAWIAGHTHRNRIRPCTASGCAVADDAATVTGDGFWRVESASLVDYPQEGRIVDVYDLGDTDGDGTDEYALRLTMIRPDPADPTASLSKELSEAEARCTTEALLAGPVVGGPTDPSRLDDVASNAQDAAGGDLCQGDDAPARAAGDPDDRDTILLP